ncbi:MAG TPA: methyltransferase domain-containing protein [Candidatus Limnocylindrales bacterium]|nr:methyltransferase domain-containing protein [Candidatus Limnocylindrales bacterium]
MSTTPRDWDGAAYDSVANPQARWGVAVVERLVERLAGDERVLDAGCGSGRVTELLLDRLPLGRVVALDGSPAMLDQARQRLAGFGDRVEFVEADLRGPLPIGEPVDAILSTATFHWIHDHAALYRHLGAVTRPGGRLVAQYGGVGNTASVRAVLATIGDGWTGDVFFADPDETRGWLTDAGWTDVEAWLQPEPTRFEPGAPFKAFLRTVILGAHLARLPEGERDAFVDAVAARLPAAEIDYVRLNVTARRGTAPRGPG